MKLERKMKIQKKMAKSKKKYPKENYDNENSPIKIKKRLVK